MSEWEWYPKSGERIKAAPFFIYNYLKYKNIDLKQTSCLKNNSYTIVAVVFLFIFIGILFLSKNVIKKSTN